MKDLVLIIQIVFFEVGWYGGLSDVLTVVITDHLIGHIILIDW